MEERLVHANFTARQRRAAALAALVGNALEWYDFAVYGYVASALGKAFFPVEVPALQSMAAFAVFAVGFLMRPVGSLLLGPLGDLLGRRQMLTVSIVIMGFASLVIGLLPTHAQIGLAATGLLVGMRMLQGFSVGGEFTGSITYATEAAAWGQRGLLSSLAVAGGLAGFSLGAATAALIGWRIGEEAMTTWGWRIPFLLGAVVALVGLQLRRSMPETLPVDLASTPLTLQGLPAALVTRLAATARQWRLVLQVMGLVSFANVIFYLAFVYLVDLTGQEMGRTAAANTVATILQTLGLPFVLWGGHLADRFGLVRTNRWGTIALLIVMPLALLIGQQGSLSTLVVALSLLLVPLMATMGAQGVLGVELVPQTQRCAVFSIAYSLAMALCAGTAPLVATWLKVQMQNSWLLVLYVLIYGFWAVGAVERSRRRLRPRDLEATGTTSQTDAS